MFVCVNGQPCLVLFLPSLVYDGVGGDIYRASELLCLVSLLSPHFYYVGDGVDKCFLGVSGLSCLFYPLSSLLCCA